MDISEFSPDAEDTRSNMLLAQMFYQFSLGVASRTTRKGSVHARGLEVECKSGSFLLSDHASFFPPRIQIDKQQDNMVRNYSFFFYFGAL